MNEIQLSIVVPITVEDLGDMSAGEIVAALKDRPSIDSLKRQVELTKNVVATYGRNIELILDEVDDLYEKAKALRELAKEMMKYVPQATNLLASE